MHLSPREQERLLLVSAADLARRRVERGSRLGATEAIALVCDEICEWAWDDVPLDDIVVRSRALISHSNLLPGVADLVSEIQVEALFPHGSVLVHVERPFGEPTATGPGAVIAGAGCLDLAPDHDRRAARLTNTGARTLWISSHFPTDELNPAVISEPVLPAGYRLDVPSGEAVSLAPGQSKELTFVAFRRSDDVKHTARTEC